MINSILTNMPSVFIQGKLNNSNNSISSSIERISSGFKINQAKDDAAGCVLSTRLKNKISGIDCAQKNVSNGENMLYQADKTLENMLDKVTRIRSLALEASNTSFGEEERLAIQNEIDQLRREVYRERDDAKYNGIKIFEPTEIKEVKPYSYEVEYIQATGTQRISTGYVCNKGDNYTWILEGDLRGNNNAWIGANAFLQVNFTDNTCYTGAGAKATLTGDDKIICHFENTTESLNVNGEDISSRGWASYAGKNVKIGLMGLGSNNDSWHGTAKAKGKISSYQLYKDGVLVRDLKPVVDNDGVVCMYDEVTGELLYNEGSGQFIAGPAIIPPPVTTKLLTLQVGSNSGVSNTIDVELNVEFGVLTGNVLNEADAKALAKSAESFSEKILESRLQVGSALNRLESVSNLQNNQLVNLNSTKSLITDTDVALETASLTQTQILQQISASLLSQANLMNSGLATRLLSFS